VTDANGCTSSCFVTLTDIAGPTCTAAQTLAPTCSMNNGSATVIANNGIAPYTYLWSDGQTTAVANNLLAGMYSVTVTDASGCTSSCTTALIDINGPSCMASETTAPTCSMSNGSATVITANGIAPYTYLWSDGQTTAIANNLIAGMYFVTVTDANGCTSSCATSLTDITGPTCIASQTTAPTCGMGNGSATATPVSGTAPYTFLWSDGQTTAVANNLSAGMYSVTVTDTNGCTSSCSTTLLDITGPTCSALETTSPTCALANGSATVTAIDGTAPYNYLWSDGQSTMIANSLAAGMYAVTITDANGCSSSCALVLTDFGEPTCMATETTAPTCAMSNGSATVIPMGGLAPYTYLWDDGQVTAVANNLSAGLHVVTVTDANSCTSSCSVTLIELNGPTCVASETISPTCGMNNGSATVFPVGGLAPYTYLWDDGQTTNISVNLSAGLHNVIVTDANGCTTSCSATLNNIDGPTCTACLGKWADNINCNKSTCWTAHRNRYGCQ